MTEGDCRAANSHHTATKHSRILGASRYTKLDTVEQLMEKQDEALKAAAAAIAVATTDPPRRNCNSPPLDPQQAPLSPVDAPMQEQRNASLTFYAAHKDMHLSESPCTSPGAAQEDTTGGQRSNGGALRGFHGPAFKLDGDSTPRQPSIPQIFQPTIREDAACLSEDAGGNNVSIEGRIPALLGQSLSTFGIASLQWLLTNEASPAASTTSSALLSITDTSLSFSRSLVLPTKISPTQPHVRPHGDQGCTPLPPAYQQTGSGVLVTHRNPSITTRDSPPDGASAGLPSCGMRGGACMCSPHHCSMPSGDSRNSPKTEEGMQQRPTLAEVWLLVSQAPVDAEEQLGMVRDSVPSDTGPEEPGMVSNSGPSESGPSVSPFATFASKDFISGLEPMQPTVAAPTDETAC